MNETESLDAKRPKESENKRVHKTLPKIHVLSNQEMHKVNGAGGTSEVGTTTPSSYPKADVRIWTSFK